MTTAADVPPPAPPPRRVRLRWTSKYLQLAFPLTVAALTVATAFFLYGELAALTPLAARGVDATGTINGSHIDRFTKLFHVGYTFDVSGTRYEGSYLSSGDSQRRFAELLGRRVAIRYLPEDPGVSRLRPRDGITPELLSSMRNKAAGVALIGAVLTGLMITFQWRGVARMHRMAAHGRAVVATISEKGRKHIRLRFPDGDPAGPEQECGLSPWSLRRYKVGSQVVMIVDPRNDTRCEMYAEILRVVNVRRDSQTEHA